MLCSMAPTSEKLRQLDDRLLSLSRSWVWLAGLGGWRRAVNAVTIER
jgi:hypothetical protein